MKCSFVRTDIEIQQALREPAFAMAKQGAEILAEVYRSVLPHCPIDMEDLSISGGATFGDLLLSVRAFGGNGTIAMRVDRITAVFRQVTINDIPIVKNFSDSAIRGFFVALPDAAPGALKYSCSAWIACEDGAGAAQEMLEKRGFAAFGMDRGLFSEYRSQFSLQADMTHLSKGHTASIKIELSAVPNANLYVRASVEFSAAGAIQERFDEARNIFMAALSHLDLQMDVAS